MTAPDRPSRRMSGEVTTAPGGGSHVEVVYDHSGSLAASWHCLKPIAGTRQWCQLAPKHKGRCLALPLAHVDITPDNPNVRDQKS